LIAPFIGIKLIDMLLAALHLIEVDDEHSHFTCRVAHALLSVGWSSPDRGDAFDWLENPWRGRDCYSILVPIGWCTVRWGQLAGVSAALTAALSFDYLFIPPYQTFNIGQPGGMAAIVPLHCYGYPRCGRIHSILTEEQERERKATFCMKWWQL